MGSASSGCSGCRCPAGTSRPEIYRTPGVALTLGVYLLQQRVQVAILHLTPSSYESERSQRPRGGVPPLRFQALQVLYPYQRGERSPPPLYEEALPPVPDARHQFRKVGLRLRHSHLLGHFRLRNVEQVILTILSSVRHLTAPCVRLEPHTRRAISQSALQQPAIPSPAPTGTAEGGNPNH